MRSIEIVSAPVPHDSSCATHLLLIQRDKQTVAW